MGVYSTVTITRKKAIECIIALIEETASNEEIGNALFALTKNHTYDNYWVVDTEEELPQ